ncbi:MAG: TonB-dependent receptor plug domain-containing protein, partial [Nevskiaceae bacterium]|nr:TonB-dependent receptor plug domain-containing protein [Nevskiaceae bacterium]
MQSRISVTATMLACAALPGIGLAQTAPAPDGGEFSSSTQFLSAVVVTALRHEKENLYVPYSISTVSSDYVDDFGPRTTPDVLNAVNGAFIQKTNLGGGSAFVRGLTGNQSLTLIDGIRLNNATFRYGPNQYLNTIDPFTIDRIEVAKGTGSVQYGTDALGGTVQLLTRNPEFATDQPGWNAKLLGRTMTHGMEQTLRGQAGYSGERFAFIGGVSSKNFGDLIGGNDTGKQSPSGYDEWSADLKTRFLLNPGAELTLAGQFLRQENVPVYHSVQLENYALREMDPQQHALTYARLNLHSDSRWTQDVTLTASWQQSLEGRNA